MTSAQTVPTELLYFGASEDGTAPFITPNSRNWTTEPHNVEVENVRGKESSFSLDTTGFAFGKHATAHTSFSNDEDIKREYYPESEELLKRITGASRIHIFDHSRSLHRLSPCIVLTQYPAIRRRRLEPTEDTPETRQPVPLVHVDQTAKASHDRVYNHIPNDAPELVKHRFQIINLWRPIGVPADDWPLALCDFRSVDRKKDLVPITFRIPNRTGENFCVNHNVDHKWKYLKGMTPDEFVLIKWYLLLQYYRIHDAEFELVSTRKTTGTRQCSLPTLLSSILRPRLMLRLASPSR